MDTATRHPIGENILKHLLPTSLLRWLHIEESTPTNIVPTLPQNIPPGAQPLPVQTNGALPQAQGQNGHANGTTPQARPPTGKDPSSPLTVLGTDIHTGQEVTVSQPMRRQGCYIIGNTGVGKTSLLLHMISQDIAADRGLALVEPHGDLTRQVLATIPQRRIKEVVYLDLTDSQLCCGLNLFQCDRPDDPAEVAKVASFVMHLFEQVWQIGTHTPQLAQVVRNVTRVLIENPGTTFAEIPLLLWEDIVREKLLKNVINNHTRLFWQQYTLKSPRDKAEAIASTINKCDAYLNEPMLAHVVSQAKTTIPLREIMDSGKILLVNLSPQLEEMSRLVGSLLVGKILMASFSRVDTPEAQRRPFNLYVDEFQRFQSNEFRTFIEEARKFYVCVTIAHQSLTQIPDENNRTAATGSGSIICFRVLGTDAELLSKSYNCTPDLEIVGQEPQRAPVADIIGHLVLRGHTHEGVTKFGQGYLAALEKHATTKMADRPYATYNSPTGALFLEDLDVQRGRTLLNDCLYRCMSEKWGDIPIAPLALYVLTVAQCNTMDYVFSPYIRSQTKEVFGDRYLAGFAPGMAAFGRPDFLTGGADAFVQRQHRKHRWMAERIVSMLRELRSCMRVLGEQPVLVDTGQYTPVYRRRTYADQENLISNELSTLPDHHAKVRLLTGEHLIKTNPPPPLLSESEVTARIARIKQHMLDLGYCKPYREVEREVQERQEQLRKRPASDDPPPTHSIGNRRTRGKTPPVR